MHNYWGGTLMWLYKVLWSFESLTVSSNSICRGSMQPPPKNYSVEEPGYEASCTTVGCVWIEHSMFLSQEWCVCWGRWECASRCFCCGGGDEKETPPAFCHPDKGPYNLPKELQKEVSSQPITTLLCQYFNSHSHQYNSSIQHSYSYTCPIYIMYMYDGLVFAYRESPGIYGYRRPHIAVDKFSNVSFNE